MENTLQTSYTHSSGRKTWHERPGCGVNEQEDVLHRSQIYTDGVFAKACHAHTDTTLPVDPKTVVDFISACGEDDVSRQFGSMSSINHL